MVIRVAGMSSPAVAVGLFAALFLAGCGPANGPATSGGPVAMRRLTESQYRQSIADIFGPDVKIGGRFEPDIRTDGLLAVGTSEVTVSRAGFEQFDAMARTISAQVVDEKHRGSSVPCQPATANAPDEACATQFVRKFGRLLFRRPLSQSELQARVAIATHSTEALHNFYSGLEFALADLLVSPKFLFRTDATEPDPADPAKQRLTGFSKASRLSFLLWNTSPDEELIAAGERGELDSRSGLSRQVDRMMASPRLEAGVRAFFTDFLGFEGFDALEKDPLIYPAYKQDMIADAKEQTLRTITDHLIARRGDYRDLFTVRRTFLSRPLGVVYALPVESEKGWEPYEFPEDDPRAGLLTEVSFTALYAHPGRSSATLRGKAVRELLLCQPVPAPPNNVNFSIVQDTANPQFKTARDRLTAHRTDPTCAGCHKIMDPIGLALENFDGLGQMRSAENGAAIDASGQLDGTDFKDAAGLGKAIHDDPAATSCLVSSLYRYATGRTVQPGEKEWMGFLQKRFAAEGYRLPDLLRTIATSDAYYALAAPAAQSARSTQGDADASKNKESKS